MTVTDIVKRAGVFNVTFYKQFASKSDCLLAAYVELLERLLEAMDRAWGAERAGGATEALVVWLRGEGRRFDCPLLTLEVLAHP